MKDKETMLTLMRFWLFGTFILVLVATTVLAGSVPGIGLAIFGQLRYWIGVLVAAVLCVAWYYIYKWYLDKRA
jgi:hypothetical protein